MTDLVELLESLGWSEDLPANPGEYVLRSGRTTYRCALEDARGYALRFGPDALREFLESRARMLEVESERNRFLERRVRGDLERDFRENPLGRTRTKPRRSS